VESTESDSVATSAPAAGESLFAINKTFFVKVGLTYELQHLKQRFGNF
jgi:hypothetical protein